MQPQRETRLSTSEYISLEQETGEKYEYYNGYVYAMAGGSYEHNTVSGNIFSEINIKLKGKSCQIMNSDTKLYVESSNTYFYPDAMIICGEKEEVKNLKAAFKNPVVIIEVLSESTEAFDRGDKFDLYRALSSLRHYVLVKQSEPKVQVYSRQSPTALWNIRTIEGLESVLDVELSESLTLEIPLSDIYDRIEFGE